jgi:hypothetical protein
LGAGLVDEDQMFRIQFALSRMPGATLFGDIFAVLLGGALRLFLSGSFIRSSVFQRQPTLTFTPCSLMSQALISSSVESANTVTWRRSASSCSLSLSRAPAAQGKDVVIPVVRRRIKIL